MNYIDSSLLIHIPETDSTNNYLSKLSDKETVPEFTVVQSDFQTAGKGQRGNSWETEKGKNLLFWKHGDNLSCLRLSPFPSKKNWTDGRRISPSNGRMIFTGKIKKYAAY